MILCICGLVTQFPSLQSHNWSIMLGDYQSGRLDKPDTTGFFGWMYMESPKARGWSEDEYFCYKEQFKERCLNELLAGKPQATPIIVYRSHLVSIHQATIRLSVSSSTYSGKSTLAGSIVDYLVPATEAWRKELEENLKVHQVLLVLSALVPKHEFWPTLISPWWTSIQVTVTSP